MVGPTLDEWSRGDGLGIMTLGRTPFPIIRLELERELGKFNAQDVSCILLTSEVDIFFVIVI